MHLLHPRTSRRTAIQAGTVGLLGLGMEHLAALRAADVTQGAAEQPKARSVIYIFLSGGLAQHDSFDMKPDAPDDIRGEFQPIETATPGIQICDHLPMLAQRSEAWAICRSLTHSSNEHSAGHHIMLTGRSDLPPGFSGSRPQGTDWPSITAIAGEVTQSRNNLPPVAVLPEKRVHNSGRVIPGQFAARMGDRRNPWFIEASSFHNTSFGAFPEYTFDHQDRGKPDPRQYGAPNLSLPHGLTRPRFDGRLKLLQQLGAQRQHLDRQGGAARDSRFREAAISLLTDERVHRALDVTRADDQLQQRYGKNSFGWSLLMARQLVELGVNMVQVNLGNDETWDTHGNAFPHLKDKLLPPTDRAVSALLDDLQERGMLDDTLVVMAGEFGRTPKISLLPSHYKLPGRDHWGAVQTVFFAGGRVRGGQVIGASDKRGAFPSDAPQTPEQLAATIYDTLGLPHTVAWHDEFDRPHHIYHGAPIEGLT